MRLGEDNYKFQYSSIVSIILLVIYIIGHIVIIINNAPADFIIIAVSSSLIILFITKVLIRLLYQSENYDLVSFMLETSMLLIYYSLTGYNGMVFLFTIVLTDGILYSGIVVGLVTVFLSSIIYHIIMYGSRLFEPETLSIVILELLNYWVIFTAVGTVKKLLVENQRNRDLTRLVIEQSKEIEQVAVLEEQERIAGELHDTLGHSLSIALIELEATRTLFNRNPEIAYDKLISAQNQVSSSLEEVRHVVRAMKHGEYNKSLMQIIESTANSLMKQGLLEVETEIHVNNKLIPLQKKVIALFVKECITNVIKHTDEKKVIITVNEAPDTITFSCRNETLMTKLPHKSFGLEAMEKRIIGIGGVMKIEIKNDYYIVSGIIPVMKEGISND